MREISLQRHPSIKRSPKFASFLNKIQMNESEERLSCSYLSLEQSVAYLKTSSHEVFLFASIRDLPDLSLTQEFKEYNGLRGANQGESE